MDLRDLTRAASAAIDWDAPWFAAVARAGRAIRPPPDHRESLNAAATALGVRTAGGAPVRFASPDAAGERPYEAHIARTGEVPTRDNRHDFFNALVWLAFPRAKARLNALQAGAIAVAGVGSRRGPLRDAATLVDENALLLVTERADLVEALRARDWRTLLVERRAAWPGAIRPIAFGHALMEKLTRPYKAITAHALAVRVRPDAALAEIDAWVAAHLDATLAPTALMPLPVLGIPGWADGQDDDFYADAAVFRPRAAGDRPATGERR